MLTFSSWVAGLHLVLTVEAFVDYGYVYPAKYALGKDITINANTVYNKQSIALSSSNPVLTIDYGTEAAGFPRFDVCELSGPTQIEVKYTEQYPGLENVQGDGPWTFTEGLTNTFRVETFNLTDKGVTESFFIQGGQRWQSVRLLTDTTISFSSIGLRATSGHSKATDVAGKLSTSNSVYNEIWNLGARCVQEACIDAGNAVTTWEITPDGALIRGQQTSQSAKGLDFANYTLSFMTKIVRGGTGWRVASDVNPSGSLFILTSDYPESSTFVNTNRTLVPPNTLIYATKYYLLNQTTVPTGPLQYFPLSKPVPEHQWHNVSTTISGAGFNVSLNGEHIAFVTIAEAKEYATGYTGPTDPTKGSFGFGPFQDEIAYYKDVNVVAENGTLIYGNPMTSQEVLAEYNVATLDTSVCLDGAKRDRLVWIGDFYHTSRIIPASTDRLDFILGTLEYVFSYQAQAGPTKGYVPISALLGARPEYQDPNASLAGLDDYQDLLLAAIGNYFRATADTKGLGPLWSQIKELVAARMAYIDPVSGLISSSGFLGPANGSADSALHAFVLQNLVPVAQAFNENALATTYADAARDLNTAINAKLWNHAISAYSLSLANPNNYSLTAIALTILSGAANASQAQSMIQTALPKLQLGVGFKTGSGDVASAATQLSPNTQGFLLDALFKAHRDLGVTSLTSAKFLLDNLWSSMATQNEYYSGASWEYLYPDGSPGLDLFTSLAHPWGGAPTYVLPEYVLGIAPTSPGFKTWEFTPLLSGLNLTEAQGTVVTPYGSINAKWEITKDGSAVVTANVPHGTTGKLVLPGTAEAECNGRRYGHGQHVTLHGGQRSQVHVKGWPHH